MSAASITEQMLETINTKFASITGATVFRSRQAALALAEGIAVILRPKEEPVRYLANSVAVRELGIEISIIGRGAVPDQTIDPVRVQMHQYLMADPTLGGLAQRIVEQGNEWEFEEADQTGVELKASYKIIYANRTNSLTVPA
jgi:hypothetical protein